MKRVIPLLCALLLAPASLAAEECRVELRNDFRVSSKALEVSSVGDTLYVIRQGGELSVGGEAVTLDTEQRDLAEQYAGDVGALASQWVELVSEALGLVGESLERALGEAFGGDSDAAAQTGIAIARAREKFDSMTRPEDGVYTVSAYEFNELGEVLGEEIEEAVKVSVGALLIEIGETLSSGEGSFQDRMEAFGQRMELMGGKLEHMGASLEETADRLCTELRALQKLERKVADEIPELEDYPLFSR